MWIIRAVAGYNARSRGRNWDRSHDKRLLRNWQSIPIGRRFETVNDLHRITTQFVKKYDFFAIEDLSIISLTRSARGTLENPGQGVTIKSAANRTMLEQTWGEFAQILTYKAEGAGMSVVRVDPAYTSLTCSRCGVAQFDSSRQERNRIRFRCPDCGNDLNRSVNAAKNILARASVQPSLSAGESVIAGRASMETSTPEMSGVRPENLVGA